MKTIKVNGESIQTARASLGYGEILELAGYKPDRTISVTYHVKLAGGSSRQGSLSRGQSVDIADGMIFNAKSTSKA